MKVILTTTKGEYGEDEHYEVKTPKSSVSFGYMEPEDATLCRDLSDAYNIPAMIREAHAAGKAGEDLEFEDITDEEVKTSY